jgi:hypothetical protein
MEDFLRDSNKFLHKRLVSALNGGAGAPPYQIFDKKACKPSRWDVLSIKPLDRRTASFERPKAGMIHTMRMLL